MLLVSGDVKTGNWYGVKYVHHSELIDHRGPRGLNHKSKIEVYEHYDVVIATNYITLLLDI